MSLLHVSPRPIRKTLIGFRRAAALGAGICGIAILTTVPAMAAGQLSCAALKQAIEANGHYVYHYSDPAKPGLDLYETYVKSNLQCNSDATLVSEAVPLLADCDVPKCVMQDGDASR